MIILMNPYLMNWKSVCFVDADYGKIKVNGRLISGLISVVKSTPKIWSSKRQTAVQTSTFFPACPKGYIIYFGIFLDRFLGLNLHFQNPNRISKG